MIEPIRDKIVIKRDDVAKTTTGGIILTESSQELAIEGTVMAVGTGKIANDGSSIPVSVSVGDRVLIGKFVGTEIILDNENFVVVVESEIIGILGD